MSTFKSLVRRGSLLGATGALVLAAIAPAGAVFAQAASLTPLTERSLLLSSSAPGYVDTDGSGFRTGSTLEGGNPAQGPGIPDTYAPAGSGPNGKKTGQTFNFRASSSASIEALTFQYCMTAAGMCQAPGNNTGDNRTNDENGPIDPAPAPRQANAGVGGGWENNTSDLDVTGSFAQAGYGVDAGIAPTAGQFQISVNGTPTDTDDWTFSATNWETTLANPRTGKNNLITLRSTTGTQINAGDYVEVKFVASESIYITNPGNGHFFVKINTYNDGGATAQLPDTNANIVDGGVTVANVMTDSIHITTKVLETMSFSVGIQNPDTIQKTSPAVHTPCEPISQTSTITGLSNNRLNLGNPDAEFSLETGKAWDVFSYWRLSSNSSGGATVYYSGNTLANTVGDEIRAMAPGAADPAVQSTPGGEQFGLGFVDINSGDHADVLSASFLADVADSNKPHFRPDSYPFITVAGQTGSAPRDFTALAAQPISTQYRNATGTIDNGSGGAGTASFKFRPSSLTVPEPIAQQNETVVSCATAKMRYVANIGADTPAGVYTTKINYLAAPQY